MRGSRTGTARHKKWAAAVKRRARLAGITRCPRCRVWLDYERGRRPNSAEPDHITPHIEGGRETMDNGRVICRRCNQKLGAKLANERRKARGQGGRSQVVPTIDFRPGV